MAADLDELRAAYRAAVDADRQRTLTDAWIRNLQDEETTALSALERAQAEAELEQAEADSWAGKGFRNALWGVFGLLEGRRQKETAEALAAAAHFAAARTKVDDIRGRLTELRSSRTERPNVAGAEAALRNALVADDPAAHQRLVWLEQTAAAATAQVREHDEAIAALDRAGREATEALELLNSAGNWGTWDIVGGGIISSAIKRDKVREAIGAIGRAGVALEALRRELGDIPGSIAVPEGLLIGSGAWTFDVWFDNIFSDLNMQARIRSTEDQVRTVAEALAATRPTLVRARQRALDEARRTAADAATALTGP